MKPAKISRDEKQIQTRNLLIEAGFHLISEQGYSAVSIRNISKYAGYTQGAFYSNFEHKEDFLLTLLKIQFEQENQQLQKMITQANLAKPDLKAALEQWFVDFFQHDEWLKISIELQLYAARDPVFSNEYQQVWQNHQAQILEVLLQLIPNFSLAESSQRESKLLEIISLSYGLALQYMIFKDDIHKYVNIMLQQLDLIIPSA
ncbi:TetR/AcrR family transcriptional regulator [Acinetobacter zhairhuonensis]|uniref:TetR/AcrR family transcriptional regulator n=1 Tax=Acinetobacter sp. A7.4 TaxID=2919921 RepID=UPI001F4F69C4|nr:TetR/AcrR family transcriptional regulator [Acinetobacter sp. A7.4]MCJ8162227.1 TetR/AcrR family transcriptional regulator [Acinetobacter sp. A7.4]